MKPGHGRRGGRKICSMFRNRGRVPLDVAARNDTAHARALDRSIFAFSQFLGAVGRSMQLPDFRQFVRMRAIERKRVAA